MTHKKVHKKTQVTPTHKVYKCRACDKIISAWWTNRKYCGPICRRTSRPLKVHRCVMCDIVFEPPTRSHSRRTCSSDCLKLWQSIFNQQLHKSSKAAVMPIAMCPICGNAFKVFNAHGYRRSTCQKACAVKYSWRMTARKKRNYNVPRSAHGQFIK